MLRQNTFKMIVYGLLITLVPAAALGQRKQALEMSPLHREISVMETIFSGLILDAPEVARLPGPPPVRGIYIPEVGVIFQIHPAFPSITSFYYRIRQQDDSGNSSVYISGQSSGGVAMLTPDSSASLVDDLREASLAFLENYADALDQLGANEHILVVYDSKPALRRPFLPQSGLRFDDANGNGFVISAKRDDVLRLQRKQIDRRQFRRRINAGEVFDDRKQVRELHIFANALETALQSRDYNTFTLTSDISNLYLDDHGAVLLVDAAHLGSGYNVWFRIDEIHRENMRAIERMQQLNQEIREGKKDPQQGLAEILREILTDSSRVVDLQRAYATFEQNVASRLLDYGRTLQSLKPAEKITFALNIRENAPGIPQHVVFQLGKDDLDAYSARKLSKGDALRKVSIARYGN